MEARLFVAGSIVAAYLVTIFYLLHRGWRFRAALFAAYFIATTIDLLFNALGVSTAIAYVVFYRRLSSGGIVILFRLPVIASILILLKTLAIYVLSILYDTIKYSLPEFLRTPRLEEVELRGKD